MSADEGLRLAHGAAELFRDVLGGALVGAYAHGSIAFGCFRRESSDVDVIAVARAPLTKEQKLAILRGLFEMENELPPKGAEISVVLAGHCDRFVYPTPYELHYSAAWRERYLKNPLSLCGTEPKTDPDLAAHFTVLRAVGIALIGPPAREVFGDVPRDHFLDSVAADVREAALCASVNPTYAVLNLCRTLAYIEDGLILSKAGGGEWGLRRYPAFADVIAPALAAYTGKANAVPPRGPRLSEFCSWALDFLPPYLRSSSSSAHVGQ